MRIDEVAARLFPEPTEVERERAVLLLFAAGFSGSGSCASAALDGPDGDPRLLGIGADSSGIVLRVTPEHPWAAVADLHTDEEAALSEHLIARLGCFWLGEAHLSVFDDEDHGTIRVAVQGEQGLIVDGSAEQAVAFVAVALAALRGMGTRAAQAARTGSLSEALGRGRR